MEEDDSEDGSRQGGQMATTRRSALAGIGGLGAALLAGGGEAAAATGDSTDTVLFPYFNTRGYIQFGAIPDIYPTYISFSGIFSTRVYPNATAGNDKYRLKLVETISGETVSGTTLPVNLHNDATTKDGLVTADGAETKYIRSNALAHINSVNLVTLIDTPPVEYSDGNVCKFELEAEETEPDSGISGNGNTPNVTVWGEIPTSHFE